MAVSRSDLYSYVYEYYEDLITAIMKLAVLDYAKAICTRDDRGIYELEQWFGSEEYSILTKVPGDVMITMTVDICKECDFRYRRVQKMLNYHLYYAGNNHGLIISRK